MPQTYLYAVIGVGGAIFNIVLVNWAMSIYDQAESGPIFSAFLIIFSMSAGAFIEDEKDLYKIEEMLLLVFYSLICIMGIFMITRKELLTCLENKMIFGQDQDLTFSDRRQQKIREFQAELLGIDEFENKLKNYNQDDQI